MSYKKITYLNTLLFIVAVFLAVNTLSVRGHEFIRSVLAAVGDITGEGTGNYIARFAAGANPSNQIGDSIIYDDGAGHVGIGTTTPGASLEVYKNAGWTNIYTRFDAATDKAVELYADTNGPYILYQGSTLRIGSENGPGGSGFVDTMSLTTDNKVGIGTTAPLYPLSVEANAVPATISVRTTSSVNGAYARYLLMNDWGSNSYADLIQYSSGTGISLFGLPVANRVMLYSSGANSEGLLVGTNTSDPLIFGTNNVERMRILSGGNVGIGTTVPNSKLSITTSGASYINIGELSGSATYSGISFGSSSTAVTSANYSIIGGGTYTLINRPTGGDIRFRENNEDQVTIQTGGEVGIGTADPQYKLSVAGNIVNYIPSSGYLGLTGDLPGYATNLYPALKTDGAYLYFASGGGYRAWMGAVSSGIYSNIFEFRDPDANPNFYSYIYTADVYVGAGDFWVTQLCRSDGTNCPAGGGGDDLGNHTATQHLKMACFWIDLSGGGGLWSTTYGNYFWAPNSSYWYMRSDAGMTFYNNAGVIKGFIYHNSSNDFGLVSNDGNWRVRTYVGGQTLHGATEVNTIRLIPQGQPGGLVNGMMWME